MAYTETTTQSYGSRLGGSLKGMFTGLLIFLGATALLWWNEGRAVKQSDAISQAESNYVEMSNPKKVDPSLDGELVYATCMATTNDSLRDEIFGVSVNAIRLIRKVEFYQWQEEARSESHDKVGGSQETTTTYTYKLGWTNRPIDSGAFKNPQYKGLNTVLANVERQEWSAENVTFGAYTLPEFAIESLTADEAVRVQASSAQMQQLEKSLNPKAKEIVAQQAEKVADAIVDTDSVAVPKMQYETEYVHVGENQIYLGKNPNGPNVGDVRITYYMCSPTKCSLIAKVKGNTFTKYKTDNGKMFSLVDKGVVAPDEMIQGAKDANSTWTWILRLVGLLLIYSGLRALLGFPEMLLKVLPFLSTILGFGMRILCCVLTVIWAGLIIALAWLFYRPILSICLIAVAVAAGFALWKYRKSKKIEKLEVEKIEN